MHTGRYTVLLKVDCLEGKINILLQVVTICQDTAASSFAEGYMM
jgi:hypothetical protein